MSEPGRPTPEEIRLRLRAARVSGDDDTDPAIAAALAQAEADPALARWLAGERAADAAFAQALGAALPPTPASAERKAEIVAAMQAKAGSRKTAVPVPTLSLPRRSRRRAFSLLALAAAVAFAAFVAPGLARPSYLGYEGDLAEQIVCGDATHLALQNPDHTVLQQWLAAHRAPDGIAIPPGLQPRPGVGCRTFEWKGRQIGQVCFVLEDGKIVHLFVVRNAGWRPSTAPPQGHPQFNRHGEWTLASWREGRTTYVLAGEGDPEMLKKLL